MELKIAFLIIVASVSNVLANPGYSQVAKVSLNMENRSLEQVMDEIEKQSEFYFIFNQKQIDVTRVINIQVENKLITDILPELFKGTNINYAVFDRKILLTTDPLENNLLAIPSEIEQQQNRITGTVKDEKSNPLPGVTVLVKGTTLGVLTDVSGQYTINNAPQNATLIFSFVGMATQEIPLDGRILIDVVLKEEAIGLEEVVVVGYGTQKRENLTGAVATIGATEIKGRPSTTAGAQLQGKIANLNITNTDGGPGKKASINIRGYSGLGTTNSPLYIIDGVTGYFDDLNPNDIETFTVLKDAAASAIYGAQAAYGVVLITTKSGKKNEKPVISYNSNFSFNSPTVFPELAGSVEFANLFREASINGGGGGVISLETIARIEQYYNDPTSIPNDIPQPATPNRWSDWTDGNCNANENWPLAMFKNNQLNQTQNILVKGGGPSSTYMMSLGYAFDGGKLRYYNDNYDRINALVKINTDVTKWLSIGVNIRYADENTVTPAYYMSPDGGINSLISWIYVVWPTIPVFDPNGHFSPAGRMAFINQANPNTTIKDNFWGTGTALFKILPGWTANIDFTYNKSVSRNTFSKGLIYSWSVADEPYLDSTSPETTQVWQRSNNSDYTTTNVYTTYEKGIKGHNFKLLVGTQQENNMAWALNVDKKGLVLPSLPSVSTATGIVNASDAMDHWRTLGFFGRLNYDYNGKYLLELDLRRDGSSRYIQSNQWGTFPALSAGWNIAKENFFKPYTRLFSQLKLRGSWGELGNMRGAAYQYISTVTYNPAYSYIMGSSLIGAYGTPSLTAINTWEENRTLDFGIDIASLGNKLTISFDWYQRDIIGLIAKGTTLPADLGAVTPSTNNTNIRNLGWEFNIGWKHSINVAGKPFNYGVTFNISDYQGTVLKYSNPTGLLSDYYVGKKMGEIWGYTTDHIMIDPAEAAQVNSSGSQKKFGSNWVAGDMMYKDLDGSGVIDNGINTLDSHGDQTVIGNNTPRFPYGFNFNAEWNGFDISAMLQGIGKRDLWLSGVLSWGLGGGQWSSNVWKNTLDCWREDGSNQDPYWPRFYLGSTSKNLQTQTKYLNDASYCRVKNIQIGYTLPKSVLKFIGIERVHIYCSGDNLFTFSKINKNFDPESPSSSTYPLSQTVSFGIDVTF